MRPACVFHHYRRDVVVLEAFPALPVTHECAHAIQPSSSPRRESRSTPPCVRPCPQTTNVVFFFLRHTLMKTQEKRTTLSHFGPETNSGGTCSFHWKAGTHLKSPRTSTSQKTSPSAPQFTRHSNKDTASAQAAAKRPRWCRSPAGAGGKLEGLSNDLNAPCTEREDKGGKRGKPMKARPEERQPSCRRKSLRLGETRDHGVRHFFFG